MRLRRGRLAFALAAAIAALGAPAAHADVYVSVSVGPAAVGGLGVHTYDANGQLAAGAPTATGASGVYVLPTSAITGAALPLQVRVDPIVDQCTGQTLRAGRQRRRPTSPT